MSETLEGDDRGVILVCPNCATGNRIAFSKLGEQGRCGSCKAELPQPSLPVDISSSTSFARLTEDSPIPVVIDFWAPWCGPCQMMGPEFGKVAGMMAGEAIFVKVNTEKLSDIAGRFQITGIPAIAILKNGQEIERHTGAMMSPQLIEWVREHI